MGAGYVSSLLGFGQTTKSVENVALANILDNGQAEVDHEMDEEEGTEAAEQLEMKLRGEHLLRVQAEANAQDRARRLEVAQEQLAEYAAERKQEAASLTSITEDLGRLVQSLQHTLTATPEAEQKGAVEGVVEVYRTLQQRVQEQLEASSAFAEQQQQDVERTKRKHQEAELRLRRLEEAAQQAGQEQQQAEQQEDGEAMDEGGEDQVAQAEGAEETGQESQQQQQDGQTVQPPQPAEVEMADAMQDTAEEGLDEGPQQQEEEEEEEEETQPLQGPVVATEQLPNGEVAAEAHASSSTHVGVRDSFLERAKYIPMRLTLPERRLLRLLEAALSVSEYTDKVDVIGWRSRTGRVVAQIRDICAILSGLVVAQNYKEGQRLLTDRSFADNEDFFQQCFEIGRRHKIMNPEKMRSEYGKLVYMLMDSAEAQVQELLQFKCVRPLRTVYQGLNRVQQAPRVGRAMNAILARSQAAVGTWVGSSVVHLGDHNVPNALMFIDKYTQVPRILNPVVLVLQEIPALCSKDPRIAEYVERAFGGPERCVKLILTDFFRHAFDGSGADNFFDAGSCIDGRLTSAWNWCSRIEKKSYYPVFRLCGFTGFDGDFR